MSDRKPPRKLPEIPPPDSPEQAVDMLQFWHRMSLDTRAVALREATHLVREWGMRVPVTASFLDHPGWRCQHREECDCPPPTREQWDAYARLYEETELDRVLRIADLFADWLGSGVDMRELRREAEFDRLTGLDPYGDEP